MSLQVGIGLSTAKSYTELAQEAVEAAKAQIGGGKIDLALVFTSVGFAHIIVLETIHKLLGPVTTIGSSSSSIIFNQAIFKHGLLLMLLRLPKDITSDTACVREISRLSGQKAGEELAQKLFTHAKDGRKSLGIVLCDCPVAEAPQLLTGLRKRLPKGCSLMGASLSDHFESKKNYIYSNEDRLNDAACAITLSGKINFGLSIKHGWQPIGKERRVTKSSGNTVEEIDDRVAVKVYEEYFGRSAVELKDDLQRISIFYPLGILLKGEKEYLLRNILSIEDNGSLVFQGDVPQEAPIRLMIGSKEACLDAARKAAEEVKKQLSHRKIDFVLVFDSLSRYTLLGRQAAEEIKVIKDVLGRDAPLAGIYTYGEEAAHFYNQSIAILGVAS